MFDYFSYFSDIQRLYNWNMVSLDVNSTYSGPRFGFVVEINNNTCFPCGISCVLNTEEEGLALLTEDMNGL